MTDCDDFRDLVISDDELAELALAAAHDTELAPGAVPWNCREVTSSNGLPEWYMPAAVRLRSSRSTRTLVAAVIFGFLLIDASGLCITSGFLTLA